MKTDINKIISEHKDLVYNLSIGFQGDPDAAKDMTQEVFIKVFQNLDTFKKKSELKTWIYRITVNTNLELIRKNKNQLILSKGYSRDRERSDFRHPGVKMEEKERATKLFGAIKKLPENQRTVFTLAKIEGMSYAEISNVIEKSISSVESLMFRATQNLRKLLHEFYYETSK